MKRIILAAIVGLFSLSAFAIDITITLTAQQMNRVQRALGEVRNLTTPGTPGTTAVVNAEGVVTTPAVAAIPGVPRDATVAEVKVYLADDLRILVHGREREKAQKVAVDAVSAPVAFDPQ